MSQEATTHASCARRLAQHMLGTVLCPERSTLSNLICTFGGQHADWSADYRLYSKDRVEESVLFGKVRDEVLAVLPPQASLVVALDDTLVRKSGPHIEGVKWRRDPLGPAFQTNLVLGQRYLQFSAAWPLQEGEARMVPIGFYHVPGAGKAPRGASEEQLKAHREVLKQQSLSRQALVRLEELRGSVPEGRHIVAVGDGSFTNKSVIRELPAGITYIGRTRKDNVLHFLPDGLTAATGRRPSYGKLAPSPEELRSDESVPWERIGAFAAGNHHEFRIKTLGPVLWRKSGAKVALRVVVIAPLGYRLRKGAKMLYRQPAYLLCTDPEMPVAQLLQDYLWRWGIEVNFREEKTLIGTGDAQVRTGPSNQHLPAVTVAAYALLWIAALRILDTGDELTPLPRPKWRKSARDQSRRLPTTGELIRLLRYETWAGALRPGTFFDFVSPTPAHTNAQKPTPSLPSVLFDAA